MTLDPHEWNRPLHCCGIVSSIIGNMHSTHYFYCADTRLSRILFPRKEAK